MATILFPIPTNNTCIAIATSARQDCNTWSAHVLDYINASAGQGDHHVRMSISISGPELKRFYEGPAMGTEDIRPEHAAVWCLHEKLASMIKASDPL